jgi:hypothetical protein
MGEVYERLPLIVIFKYYPGENWAVMWHDCRPNGNVLKISGK